MPGAVGLALEINQFHSFDVSIVIINVSGYVLSIIHIYRMCVCRNSMVKLIVIEKSANANHNKSVLY